MKRTAGFVIVTFIAVLLGSWTSRRGEVPFDPDDPAYIKSVIKYDRYYPFINYSNNFVEWFDARAIEHFFGALKNSDSKKVRVLHIGDSHVQADIFTGYIREHMQDVFGSGGRGFIFPYAAAGTHAAYDYRSSYTGSWEGLRSVQNSDFHDMGLTGATVWTTDSNASLRFTFQYETLKPSFTRVKIWCKKESSSFDLRVKYDNSSNEIFLKTNSDTDVSYVTCLLPSVSDVFEIQMACSDSLQTGFECYGVQFETADDKGIVYNSVGINGAGFNHVLKENLFIKQLKEFKPDLVVLDLGANDYYLGGVDWKEFENNLEKIIDNIRLASKETSIILSCSQDIYRRRVNVTGTQEHSKIIKRVASAKKCAFYNYFKISGGQYSMYQWRKYGLANKDYVHLVASGYYVKGGLIFNGILNSYLKFLDSEAASLNTDDGFTYNPTDSIFAVKDTDVVDPYSIENDITKTKIFYKVKKGENVLSIAKKYKLSAYDIKDWNNLNSNYLKIGQLLVLYVNKPKTVPQAKKPAPGKPPTPKAPLPTNVVKYKVKYGDSLWSIAKKYKVTIAQIQAWNNIKNNTIMPGQVLIIKK